MNQITSQIFNPKTCTKATSAAKKLIRKVKSGCARTTWPIFTKFNAIFALNFVKTGQAVLAQPANKQTNKHGRWHHLRGGRGD